MNATRATPIINADAVDAVRRGCRIVFSLASFPVMPRIGAESSRATGPAANGARVDMPMNRTDGSCCDKRQRATVFEHEPDRHGQGAKGCQCRPDAFVRVRRDLGVVLAPVSDIAAYRWDR